MQQCGIPLHVTACTPLHRFERVNTEISMSHTKTIPTSHELSEFKGTLI